MLMQRLRINMPRTNVELVGVNGVAASAGFRILGQRLGAVFEVLRGVHFGFRFRATLGNFHGRLIGQSQR